MKTLIDILKPGLLTTIQDDGRWGYQQFGVPVSGPMDRVSHRLANFIVGNPWSAATLEVTFDGPELKFCKDVLFGITGARFNVYLDGSLVRLDTCQLARSGQKLRFGRRLLGARSYLAVTGGFDVPKVFGSRSTHIESKIGGFKGRSLKAGDKLAVGGDVVIDSQAGFTRASIVTLPRKGTRVRVIPGPNDSLFSQDILAKFVSSRYYVGIDSDRMGYRLDGLAVSFNARDELISTAVPVGSIQVTNLGKPIILMADHQTTGGYPRIGTIITADLPLVGQLSPGDWIQFEWSSQSVAMNELIAQERALMS